MYKRQVAGFEISKLWKTQVSENYEFLTVDSDTGDLAIVDSSSGLEAITDVDGGGLRSTGNFDVNGNLTVGKDDSSTHTLLGSMTVGGNFIGGTEEGNNHIIRGTLNADTLDADTVRAGTLIAGDTTVDGKLDLTESDVNFNTNFLDLEQTLISMWGTVGKDDGEDEGVEKCLYSSIQKRCADIKGKQNYFKLGNHMVVYGSFKWDSDNTVRVAFDENFARIPIVLIQRVGYIGSGADVVAQINSMETTTSYFTINRPDDYKDTNLFHWVAIGGA